GECRKTQGAGEIAGRSDRGQADSRLRREVGSISDDASDFHHPRLFGSFVRELRGKRVRHVRKAPSGKKPVIEAAISSTPKICTAIEIARRNLHVQPNS